MKTERTYNLRWIYVWGSLCISLLIGSHYSTAQTHWLTQDTTAMSFHGREVPLNGLALLLDERQWVSTEITDLKPPFTIEYWCKLDQTSSAGSLTYALGAFPYFMKEGSTGTERYLFNCPGAKENKWYHVSIVVNESTSLDMAVLYVNGAFIDKVGVSKGMIQGKTLEFRNPEGFKGVLDEVKIWKSARSEGEVWEDVYNFSYYGDSSLVAAYNFTALEGSRTFTDLTGNQFPARLKSQLDLQQSYTPVPGIGKISDVGKLTTSNFSTQILQVPGEMNVMDYARATSLIVGNSELVPGTVATINGAVHISPESTEPTPFDTVYGSDYLLWVEKGIVTSDIHITDADYWSDHVFSPDYELISLDSVQAFISERGRLPGIPSEQEVMQKGIDIHDINARLLEKVEELTLHIIAQRKILLERQQRIDRIKVLREELIQKRESKK